MDFIFKSAPIYIKFEMQTLKNISLNTCFMVFVEIGVS